ncbi:MAG: hypothetical protein IKI42_01105 [Clostridia bacterium]|nr:hypothetical protein [Clostridia bacterium]
MTNTGAGVGAEVGVGVGAVVGFGVGVGVWSGGFGVGVGVWSGGVGVRSCAVNGTVAGNCVGTDVMVETDVARAVSKGVARAVSEGVARAVSKCVAAGVPTGRIVAVGSVLLLVFLHAATGTTKAMTAAAINMIFIVNVLLALI